MRPSVVSFGRTSSLTASIWAKLDPEDRRTPFLAVLGNDEKGEMSADVLFLQQKLEAA